MPLKKININMHFNCYGEYLLRLKVKHCKSQKTETVSSSEKHETRFSHVLSRGRQWGKIRLFFLFF